MYKLKIITSTIRPGRKSSLIGRWMLELAEKNKNFDTEFLDLGVINLPLMNEPVHPMMKQYEHEHTKNWSVKIDEADAFIFVTAEYDYSYPAPLKNALEYLVHEWAFKPAGIISYSTGSFAGIRAFTHLKGDLLSLRTITIPENVHIPMINELIHEEGLFVPDERILNAANMMLQQLVRWSKGLKIIKEDSIA